MNSQSNAFSRSHPSQHSHHTQHLSRQQYRPRPSQSSALSDEQCARSTSILSGRRSESTLSSGSSASTCSLTSYSTSSSSSSSSSSSTLPHGSFNSSRRAARWRKKAKRADVESPMAIEGKVQNSEPAEAQDDDEDADSDDDFLYTANERKARREQRRAQRLAAIPALPAEASAPLLTAYRGELSGYYFDERTGKYYRIPRAANSSNLHERILIQIGRDQKKKAQSERQAMVKSSASTKHLPSSFSFKSLPSPSRETPPFRRSLRFLEQCHVSSDCAAAYSAVQCLPYPPFESDPLECSPARKSQHFFEQRCLHWLVLHPSVCCGMNADQAIVFDQNTKSLLVYGSLMVPHNGNEDEQDSNTNTHMEIETEKLTNEHRASLLSSWNPLSAQHIHGSLRGLFNINPASPWKPALAAVNDENILPMTIQLREQQASAFPVSCVQRLWLPRSKAVNALPWLQQSQEYDRVFSFNESGALVLNESALSESSAAYAPPAVRARRGRGRNRISSVSLRERLRSHSQSQGEYSAPLDVDFPEPPLLSAADPLLDSLRMNNTAVAGDSGIPLTLETRLGSEGCAGSVHIRTDSANSFHSLEGHFSYQLKRASIFCCAPHPRIFDDYPIIAVGVSKGGFLIDCAQRTRQFCATQMSDTLALCWLSNDTLLHGCRDGFLRLYDLRMRTSGSSPTDNAACVFKMPSAVCWMKPLAFTDDAAGSGLMAQQLVMSSVDGYTAAIDVRKFPASKLMSQPSTNDVLCIFNGHVNSFSLLKGDVDNEERFLFLGGTDGMVRQWDLFTGRPIHQWQVLRLEPAWHCSPQSVIRSAPQSAAARSLHGLGMNSSPSASALFAFAMNSSLDNLRGRVVASPLISRLQQNSHIQLSLLTQSALASAEPPLATVCHSVQLIQWPSSSSLSSSESFCDSSDSALLVGTSRGVACIGFPLHNDIAFGADNLVVIETE